MVMKKIMRPVITGRMMLLKIMRPVITDACFILESCYPISCKIACKSYETSFNLHETATVNEINLHMCKFINFHRI